jgi:hypothetical protein
VPQILQQMKRQPPLISAVPRCAAAGFFQVPI